MKKVKIKNKLLFILFNLIIFIPKVMGASNPYSTSQTIDGITSVPCTYYAWEQAYKLGGVELPPWGDAVTWYSMAESAGYSVGSTPKPNSIAVWSHYSNPYGHVAYVVSVETDYMIVNEGGFIDIVYDEESGTLKNIPHNGNGIHDGNIISISNLRDSDTPLVGYIYLDDAPKVFVNNNLNEENQIVEVPEEKEKSNNNKLESIIIDKIDFEFDKDIYEYNLEVSNDVNKIEIKGVSLDSNAIVEGLGIYDLNENDNNFIIKVTAENGDILEYKINIKKLENYEETNNEVIDIMSNKNETKEKNNNHKYIIIGLSFTILIGIITIVLIIRKRKYKN